MDTEQSATDSCDLCGRPLRGEPVTVDSAAFCSTGCRDVAATIDRPVEDGRPSGNSADGDEESVGGQQSASGETTSSNNTRTFLRVDGLQAATGEQYLESIAEGMDGVNGAEASYVTETIQVAHDPAVVDEDDLCEALSTLGFTAYPRTDERESGRSIGPAGTGRKRGFDDTLDFRYAAGVLFGAFLVLPYVALLYPGHLSAVFGGDVFGQFAGFTEGSVGAAIVRLYLVVTAVVLFFTGMPVLRGAYVALKMRRPNTDLLVAITVVGAYTYSSIVGVVGRSDVYYDLTVVVAAVVVGAIYYESLLKRRAMDLLTDLTVSRATEARAYDTDGTTQTVAVDELVAGGRILVREGERIPVDGVLAEGDCTVDESVVTGESLPVTKDAGDEVIGGSVVTHDAAVVTVGEDATSRIDRLVSTVWNIQSAEHGVQRRANEIAGYVAPIVVGAAGLFGAAHLALGAGVIEAVLLSLTVLLVLTPWGLGLATPLSVATSIREAMERGVVVFDETVFERLRDVDVVVFDKTGTLTTGEMDVLDVDAPEDLLAATVALERRASHPAANAIVSAFGADGDAESSARSDDDEGAPVGPDGGVPTDERDRPSLAVTDFRSHANGVQGTVDREPRSGSERASGERSNPRGDDVLVGNLACFVEQGWTVDDEIQEAVAKARANGRLPVVVGRNATALGTIVVGDEPRDGWEETVSGLDESGTRVVVLTGDDAAAAETFDAHPQVDHVFHGVPPEGKTAAVAGLRSEGTVAMIGDGTNDAPALAEADLGISMGSATALASEAADVAIVDDELTAVETAFALARSARERVRQNNVLALAFNATTIPLAIAGLLNPLFAMLAVIVTCGLLVANSSRSLIDA